jgi:hypothetical protein
MPLGDGPLAVLTAALHDPAVVARYQAKIVSVPGSGCRWWTGAVSGRGHGRFYVGTVASDATGETARDLVVIAHRFAFGLVYGAAALNDVPVLGHSCDNPLCQVIGPEHARPSSHAENRRAYLARRSLAGNPLGDPRGARGKTRELRDLSRTSPAAVAAEQARLLRLGLQLPLFDP